MTDEHLSRRLVRIEAAARAVARQIQHRSAIYSADDVVADLRRALGLGEDPMAKA